MFLKNSSFVNLPISVLFSIFYKGFFVYYKTKTTRDALIF